MAQSKIDKIEQMNMLAGLPASYDFREYMIVSVPPKHGKGVEYKAGYWGIEKLDPVIYGMTREEYRAHVERLFTIARQRGDQWKIEIVVNDNPKAVAFLSWPNRITEFQVNILWTAAKVDTTRNSVRRRGNLPEVWPYVGHSEDDPQNGE